MVLLALIAGCFVAPCLAGAVYVDATYRERSPRKRLFWAGSVGILSFSGFLLPYLYAGVFHRVYLFGVKSAPVVGSPYEILLLHFAVGIAGSALSGILYVTQRY